jgi:hypothetical protein
VFKISFGRNYTLPVKNEKLSKIEVLSKSIRYPVLLFLATYIENRAVKGSGVDGK